jgi:hypothetical protein
MPATDEYVANFTTTFGRKDWVWCRCEHRRSFHDDAGKCEQCDCRVLRLGNGAGRK